MQELKLVKNLAFGDSARSQILTGVEKLTNAVGSTLGASGTVSYTHLTLPTICSV